MRMNLFIHFYQDKVDYREQQMDKLSGIFHDQQWNEYPIVCKQMEIMYGRLQNHHLMLDMFLSPVWKNDY
jgi:hypothetical protein